MPCWVYEFRVVRGEQFTVDEHECPAVRAAIPSVETERLSDNIIGIGMGGSLMITCMRQQL